MALPQPTNVPRIIEVLDPGANQLSVEVRMPPQLASKYPDKAWGTAINTIGLQKKDSDRFEGYVLVDIQPMRDSDDLKWIFEKLSGPVWTTTTVGSENIIPEKFRSQVSQTKTKQEVAPGTSPSAITGDLISSTVEAQENTGKAVKVNVSETIDANATAMVSPSLEDQLYVTTEILVAEGTLPDTGTGVVESTVQAIGKGKAIKTSKFAVTAYTNKTTYTVGYASLLNENVGSADSIPAKFRALKSLKTWRLRVQAAAPPSTPALGVGSGDYSGYDIVERAVKQTQENGSTDVFELVIVGLANTGANSLDSTTYGKIVTTTTTETLDLSAQTIDTGLAVISSTVEELGNGMTLKSTEQVQGGTWPNPVTKEVTKESGDQVPARYRKDLTRKKTTKKIAVADIPTDPTLSGNQVGKAYVKESPDRAEETTTEETLTLDTTALDEAVEQKPFVKITSTMTPGPNAIIPLTGNGSSKLVYNGPTQKIYENTAEVAVAREGPAGTEKDTKPFVSILNNKRYSTTNAINTLSGSADVVFNDGNVVIYQITETESTGRYGTAGTEQQTKPFVSISTASSYEATGTMGSGEVGGTNKIYDDGTTVVYEKKVETAAVREGPAGAEKDVKPFVSIQTDKRYAASPSIATLTGSANVVFNDGNVQVYEISEVNSTGRFGPAGAEQQAKPFVKITSTKTYQNDGELGEGEVGGSNKIYDDGTTVVYEKSVDTATAVEGPAGTEKDVKPFVSITTNKRYSESPTIDTQTGSSQVVFNDGTTQVYEVNEVASTGRYGAAGAERQVKPFVAITSTKSYQADGNLGGGEVGSSNKIYDNGETVVYEKSVETATVRSGSAGTDKEVKPFVSITTAKRYSETPDIATPTGSAQVIFNDGNVQAYEVSEPTSVARPGEKSTEQDSQPWGYIIEKTDYTEGSSPGDGGGSRLIYDDGTVKMYESSRIESLTADGTTKEKDPQQWGTLKWDGQFSTIEDGAADRSKQIFRRGSFKVFHNETASIDVSGGTVDVDPKEWGDVQWDETYDTDQKTGSGKRSRQVFRLGNHVVFLNGTPTLNIIGDAFVSAREENSLLTEVQTSSYSFATNEGVNTRSRVVFALGGQRVYENITIVRTAKGERTYPSVANVDLPPVHLTTDIYNVTRRDGQFKVGYTPRVIAGFRGPMPCTVTEYWQQAPNLTFTPTVFRPEAMQFNLPAGGGYSIGPCLHGAWYETETVNQGHPIYFPYVHTISYPATEPATWVGMKILAHVDSQPYRDGFVIRLYHVQL